MPLQLLRELVPLFEQNYQRHKVRAVIEKVLSIAAEQGVGLPPEEVMEPEEEDALVALEARQFDVAESAYKKLLTRKPNNLFAKLGLALTQLLIRTDGLNATEIAIAANASPMILTFKISLPIVKLLVAMLMQPFARLLGCVRRMSGDEKDRARTHLLDLFQLVDPNDPRFSKPEPLWRALCSSEYSRTQSPWCLFFLFAFGVMSWAPRFPELKQHLGVSNGEFGTLVSLNAFGALTSLMTVGQLVHRYGARRIMTIAATALFLPSVCSSMPISRGNLSLQYRRWRISFGFSYRSQWPGVS
ncbi:MAG: MFS transporter [Actinomycetota bacterium]